MVLLAAAVCTRGGKTLLSRQFVEMTRSRIEGLLTAFPNLMSINKTANRQHTFVETESVRYVYQPLDKIYVLLITTRPSNISEDLASLRLFAKVVTEHCGNGGESEIRENAFNLIFAFDEIVALGYRENVDLAQIRTFVEMDSHNEKVGRAVRQMQEKVAMMRMREKAKEIHRQRVESTKKANMELPGGFLQYKKKLDFFAIYRQTVSRPRKAMKLCGRSKDAESFADHLKSDSNTH